MWTALKQEVDSVFGRDPAVRTRLEVVLCYPGFHAILFYRLSHWLWLRGFKLGGRFVSHLGRFFTGIEIHPGATIGKRFFIDHGMGVVIGETAEIGDDVTLYHGVTLGDNVVVGAGAKILGPVTVGDGAAVGSNAVVLKDVPPGVSVVGIPARAVERGKKAYDDHHFAAYGATTPDMPDPVSKAINGLLEHIAKLDTRIAELEHDRTEAERVVPAVDEDAGKTRAHRWGKDTDAA